MARDADFPITVESEYLPKELLTHGWAGEVDACPFKPPQAHTPM